MDIYVTASTDDFRQFAKLQVCMQIWLVHPFMPYIPSESAHRERRVPSVKSYDVGSANGPRSGGWMLIWCMHTVPTCERGKRAWGG